MKALSLVASIVLMASPAWSQVTVVKPDDETGDVQIIGGSDNRGNIEFEVDLSGGFRQEFYVGEKRLEAEDGAPVQSYNIEQDGEFIVGTSNPDVARVTINNWIETGDGIEAAVSFINSDGRHRALDASDISAHGLDGSNRCFDVEQIGTDRSVVATHVLIDRSGSMSGHMPVVKDVVSRFLSIMPPNGICQVTSFNSSFRDHTRNYEACRSAVSGVASLTADGGTDFFSPLIQAYREIDSVTSIQKTIVIVTDGVGSGPYSLEDAKQAKTASTFVFWVGDYNERALDGLADATLNSATRIPTSLDAFFISLGEAITQQQVLLIPKDC